MCIVIRSHIAAASPVLVAHTEIVKPPCPLTAILPPKVRHRRYAVECHIFHPFTHLLYRAASDISAYIGLTAQLAAEFKKLMCTEAVVLCRTAPMRIDHLLTFLLRPDPVFPVIFISEASSRPAQYRNSDLLQRLDYIASHSFFIRNV